MGGSIKESGGGVRWDKRTGHLLIGYSGSAAPGRLSTTRFRPSTSISRVVKVASVVLTVVKGESPLRWPRRYRSELQSQPQ